MKSLRKNTEQRQNKQLIYATNWCITHPNPFDDRYEEITGEVVSDRLLYAHLSNDKLSRLNTGRTRNWSEVDRDSMSVGRRRVAATCARTHQKHSLPAPAQLQLFHANSDLEALSTHIPHLRVTNNALAAESPSTRRIQSGPRCGVDVNKRLIRTQHQWSCLCPNLRRS